MIGSTLSHFRITAKLGEGGMGEVYLAEDTKLGREVAIKVLPESVAADPERLARFEREAKVLASLNHPNIAAIYSFERSTTSLSTEGSEAVRQWGIEQQEESAGEGAASVPQGPSASRPSTVHFLVMELVEGEDLAERLQQGAIPVAEALPLALQITEGLEAAHERGIIHRDLKPANVKITPGGTVKVLDFGLAKALDTGTESDPSASPLSLSPTLTAQMTQAGVLLGTAAYMAPEQARGKKVDKRADIWAFGVVLWEMLSQEQLFAGDTVSDTLAEVLKTEPDFDDLPYDLPSPIRTLLRRCLVREPRNRLHDIADARIVLEDTLAGRVDDSSTSLPSDLPEPPTIWKALLPYSLAVLGLAIGLLSWWRPWVAAPAAESFAPDMQFEVFLPANTTAASGLALSPDGTQLAYVARGSDSRRQLWVRALDSIDARPLGGTSGAMFPFWSPDGLQVGFFSDNQLLVTDLISNSPRAIATTSASVNVRGAAWGAEDTILFAPTFTGPLMRVPASGGEPQPATQLPEKGEVGTHRFPAFLPDRKHFVVYSSGGTGTEPGMLMLGELGSLDTVELGPSSSRAVVAPPDFLIYVRGEALVAQRFDLDNQSLIGEPEVLGVTLPGSLQVSGFRSLAASSTGVLAFREDIRGNTELTWVDRAGQELGTIAADREAWQYAPRISPDGKRLVVARYESSPNVGDLWIHDLERGVADRVQIAEGDESMAAWSPDQRFLAFDAVRSAPNYGLYILPVGRPGEERLLTGTQSLVGVNCFTPDGKSILYELADEQGAYHLWILELDGDDQPTRLFPEPASQGSADLSPDGDWLAYGSDVTGQQEVYVRRLDGTGAPIRVSSSGGGQPLWRRDGRELFYVSAAPELVAVAVTPGDPPQFGRPESLFPTRFEETSDRQYDASPDGQRFVVNQPAATAVVPPIIVTSDWRRVLASKSSR